MGGVMDDWTDEAACATTDPDLWFEEKGHGMRSALKICGTCPVVTDCLWDALETGDNQWGIRGGMLPADRRKMLKGMAA